MKVFLYTLVAATILVIAVCALNSTIEKKWAADRAAQVELSK